MKVRFLGVHHEESIDTKLVSFLIDEKLAVDAGCLSSQLTFEEQQKIKAILLSHEHYDHIKGVPSFIFNNLDRQTRIYATTQTLETLKSHLFDGVIYPKFTEKTTFLKKPPIKLIPINPNTNTKIDGYKVKTYPIKHTDGSIGFEISSESGKKIFYSGDTGPHLNKIWQDISPDMIIIDVTFPNKMEEIALNASHLCPNMLKKVLIEFYELKKYYPKIVLIHLSPKYQKEIIKEVKQLSKENNTPIDIPKEGDILEV